MSTFENIEGDKILSIFQHLISEKTFIKVYLPQVDYESLTLITDTLGDTKQPTFTIDIPKGLPGALAETRSDRLAFEFTSSDKVIHRFYSDIESVSNRAVNLFFPPFIQRHQQRDNFRVKATFDSHALVIIDDQKIKMEIDNISLGGVFCYCRNRYKPLILQGLAVAALDLCFTFKNQCVNVSIQRAVVKRLEKGSRSRHFGVAFEFTQIRREEKRLLVQQIYDLQRAFLQNRLKITP